ncbi:Uncharacterised protein [Candidatus Bartonella washoeensis]|nr:Uncharacterised protein [Bartonella washoeensis]
MKGKKLLFFLRHLGDLKGEGLFFIFDLFPSADQ